MKDLYNELMEMVIIENNIKDFLYRKLKDKNKEQIYSIIIDYCSNNKYDYAMEYLKSDEKRIIDIHGKDFLNELNNYVKKAKDNYIQENKDKIERVKIQKLENNIKNKSKELKSKLDQSEYEQYCLKSWIVIEKVLQKYLNKYNSDNSFKNLFKIKVQENKNKGYYDNPTDIPKNIKYGLFKNIFYQEYNFNERGYCIIDGSGDSQDLSIVGLSIIQYKLMQDIYSDSELKNNKIYPILSFGDGDEGCVYIKL